MAWHDSAKRWRGEGVAQVGAGGGVQRRSTAAWSRAGGEGGRAARSLGTASVKEGRNGGGGGTVARRFGWRRLGGVGVALVEGSGRWRRRLGPCSGWAPGISGGWPSVAAP